MNPSQPQPPPLNIPSLLRRYGLHPRKSLGQNFLIDDTALYRILDSARLGTGEVVLEVGPGLGSLTRLLAIQAYQVIAVELDQHLLPPLQEVLAPFDNVQLIHGDILDQNIETILAEATVQSPTQTYAVVANIPYYITSALIRHLLDAPLKPDRIVLTVQKEVALRICAEPPAMSLLALSVQIFGQPRITTSIPAGAFYPVPKVDSAVIRVNVYPTPKIPPPYTEVFFRLAKAGFSQKRKNLRNALSAGLAISKAQVEALLGSVGIDPRRRAETLTLDEWKAVATYFNDGAIPG